MNLKVKIGEIINLIITKIKAILPYLKIFKLKFVIIWGGVIALLLAFVIALFTVTVDYYVLEFGGEPIGYSRNELTVSSALGEISAKFADNTDISAEMKKFKIGKITSSDWFLDCYNADEFKEVIALAAETIYKGNSLYISDEHKISIKSENILDAIIENFKKDRVAINKYVTKYNDACTVTIKENIKIVSEYLPMSEVVTADEYSAVYKVLEDNVHYTINCLQTEDEKIPYVTYYTRNEALHAGQKVVISNGIDGSKKVQYEVVVDDGELVSKSAVKETIIKQPTNAKIQIGSAIKGGLGTNLGLIFPVEGYITSEFGGRPDPFTGADSTHKGLDIGAVKGTPIYAASGGKVVQSANKYNGYGNCVIIEHSAGFRTLYAHCSELLVKEGDIVTAGQLIAKVGSTGRSTGPHLHYGMLINGTYVDPLLYY